MTKRQSQSSNTERLEFIDSLRGFALIGVYAANLLIFAGVGYMTDEQRTAHTLWLKRFQFGPMEWVWRSLTYSKVQQFRKS